MQQILGFALLFVLLLLASFSYAQIPCGCDIGVPCPGKKCVNGVEQPIEYVKVNKAPQLQKYNILPNSTTVSGISSGAFMAVQLHVAFSSLFKGAAIFSGGPFFCAEENVEIALTACMTTPSLISVPTLQEITKATAATGFIDPVENLRDSKLWIYHGTNDNTVVAGVTNALIDYYNGFVNPGNMRTLLNVSSNHAWITGDYGNDCAVLASPFISNCGFDAEKLFLTHLYSKTKWNPKTNNTQPIQQFDQSEFLPETTFFGIDPTGFIYVPKSCQSGAACSLHFALHGCEMSAGEIQDTFAVHAGLNQWAETNNIIVVYPQAHKNFLNPRSCWDWFGYTGPAYASKHGFQMSTIRKIVQRISGQ